MIVASLVLVFALFGVYGWLCGVESGLAVLRLLPGSVLTRHALKLLTPVWELANIVLILGFLSLVVLFPHAWSGATEVLVPSLIVGAVALGLRIIMVLVLWYTRAPIGVRQWYNWLFLAVNLAVPISFGAAGIRLLTGHGVWESLPGGLLMITLCVALAAMALSYVYYVVGHTPRGRLRFVTRWLNIFLCVLGTVVLNRVSAHGSPHLLSVPFVGFMGLFALIIVCQLVLQLLHQERYIWRYISVVAIASPVFLALSNRPYLAFPSRTLTAAYGTHTHGVLVLLGLSAVAIIMLVALGVLAWSLLLAAQAATKSKRSKPLFG